MFTPFGITIIDSRMNRDEIRIIKSPTEILGFNIKNETSQHLFIEPVFINEKLEGIIIRTE